MKVLRNGPIFRPTSEDCEMRNNPIQYSLWSPTCDGLDRITKECYFNELLDIGDWLYFENMGGKLDFVLHVKSRLLNKPRRLSLYEMREHSH